MIPPFYLPSFKKYSQNDVEFTLKEKQKNSLKVFILKGLIHIVRN